MLMDILKSVFRKDYEDLTVDALDGFLKNNPGTQFVDVRGVAESRESGTLPGAVVAPLGSEALASLSRKLDTGKPLIVFCRSGNRSAMACGGLVRQGFTQVYNLAGGHSAYQRLRRG